MTERNLVSAKVCLDNIIGRFDTLSRQDVIRLLIYFCREMQAHVKKPEQKLFFKQRAKLLWQLRKKGGGDGK